MFNMLMASNYIPELHAATPRHKIRAHRAKPKSNTKSLAQAAAFPGVWEMGQGAWGASG